MEVRRINAQLIDACGERPHQSIDKIRHLVESCPDAVKIRSCIMILDEEPNEMRYEDYTQIEGYPLHFALLNETVSLEVVEYLVEQFPDAVKATNTSHGRLPLHVACMSDSVSSEIVQYLVEQWPDAVKMTDKTRNLPLHYLCEKDASSLEAVQYLVEQWPDAARVTGANGRLPLDVACSRIGAVSLEVVQFLVEQWPDAVKSIRPGEFNYLPLHASCRNASLEVIRFLVEQWPDAVKVVSWDSCICGDHSITLDNQLNRREYSYLGERLKLIMAATEPNWTPMEALFRPTNSRQLPSVRPSNSRPVNAVELLPGLATDDILGTGITWEVFCYFLHVVESVWITETVSIYLATIYTGSSSWWISIGNPESAAVKVGFSPNSPGLTVVAAVEFVLRLLTNSEQVVRLECSGHDTEYPFPVTGPTLSRFFEQTNAQRVELVSVTLYEAQCRALMTASLSNIEVQLQDCSLSDDHGCRDAFIQCLQSDGGPMELDRCQIDCQILAEALAGNSRVVKANLCLDAGMAALFRLAENQGLEELRMDDPPMDDEDWLTMCEALQTHPTLTSLYLGYSSNPHAMSDEQRKARTQAIAEMLQTNTVMRTIDIIVDDEYEDGECEWDLEIYHDLILPRLATNLFRHRLATVQETTTDPFRKSIFGRVLQSKSVRTDSNRVWMLLSNYVNIVLDTDNVANLNN